MSQDNAFDTLVHDLDDAALAGLSQAVAREAGQRAHDKLQLEDIHPNMTEAEKLRATAHIARILRGEE